MHFHLRNLIGEAKNRKRKIKIDKQKMLGDISLRKINTNSEKSRLLNKKIVTNKNLKQACVSSSRIITTSKYRK
jgi:hypothetical protein